MNLVVDIGNTRAKLAVVAEGEVVAQRSVERLRAQDLDGMLAAWPGVRRAIVSSTRGSASEAAEWLRRRVAYVLEFGSRTPVPIGNAYATPETLGCDRLAAAVGAATRCPGRNALIVDFGTAVTVDLLTADGVFRGGCISPGATTRFRALHDYTASLPLCEACEAWEEVGTTTRSAVVAGVMQGLAFEIEGHVREAERRYGDLCIFFTGGEAKYFAKRIKNTIFADCNLVFCGLNRILEYNASEENLI